MNIVINGESISYSIKKQTDKNGVERQYLRAYVIIATDPVTGKKTRVEVTAPTELEFRRKVDKIQHARPLKDVGPITLEAYMKRWMEISKLHMKPRTIYEYAYRLRRFVYNELGHYLLTDLNEDILFSYYDDLIDNHGIPSAQLVFVILNSALKAAVKEGLIHNNPQDRFRLPKVQKKPIVPLTKEEIQQIILLSKDDTLCGNAVALTLKTGLRISECIGLAVDDYNPIAKSLTIHRQISDCHLGYQLQETTKNRQARVLHLDSETASIVEDQLAKIDIYKRLAGDSWMHEHNCLFTTETGSIIKHFVLRQHLKEMCEIIHREDFVFHHLRHTFATMLHDSTNEIYIVKEVLGHSRINSTSNYVHASPERIRNALEAVSAYIND